MSLRVVYTDDFPADVAEQARWYARQRDEKLAFDYASTVEAPLEFLARNPQLGTLCAYPEPQLADLRFYLVEKPFGRHLIYYRVSGEELIAFRVVPGAREDPASAIHKAADRLGDLRHRLLGHLPSGERMVMDYANVLQWLIVESGRL